MVDTRDDKVFIYTLADKRPDFIALQLLSLHRFIRGEFTYVVLNNGSTKFLRYRIDRICSKLGITSISIPYTKYANACIACGKPLQWAFRKYMRNSNYNVIIDSDMFLIDQLDVQTSMRLCEVAGIPQSREHVNYLWNGIIIFHRPRAIDSINIMPGLVEGQRVDVGGNLYSWLKKYKPRVLELSHTSYITSDSKNLSALPPEILRDYRDEYNYEIIERKILHYARGSNWRNESWLYHYRKTKLLKKFVLGSISGTIRLPQL